MKIAMVDEKSRLVKQIKARRNRVYKSYDGGFRAELNNLMDFLNNNPYTCKVMQDIENNYPNVPWNPAEWASPHTLAAFWAPRDKVVAVEIHEEISEPTQPEERAAGDLKLINNIINGSVDADWLSQYTVFHNYDQRYKRLTERFIDPLIDYLCDTIKGDDKFVMIRSGFTDKGKKALQDAFKTLEGDIRICDPYIDRSLVIFISNISFDKANVIRVLTMQGKPNIDKEDLDSFQLLKKYYNLEIRAFNKYQNPLHDRYILSSGRSYKCGASFKDFGKKDTDIQTMDELVSDWAKTFDDNWEKASPII